MIDSRVFLDASFWIAYRDGRDPRSVQAQATVRTLLRMRTRFVITMPVFCEIHAFFSRHPGRRKMVVADLWNNPIVQFEEVTHQDQAAAMKVLSLHEDKNFSLCDVLSFVVMQRLGVTRVVTFDNHFRQFGEFEIVE